MGSASPRHFAESKIRAALGARRASAVADSDPRERLDRCLEPQRAPHGDYSVFAFSRVVSRDYSVFAFSRVVSFSRIRADLPDRSRK